MNGAANIKFDKVVLDCKNPSNLADFYMKLLGWQKVYDKDGFIIIKSESCPVCIAFQQNDDYVRPVWPEKENEQQMMVHIDFAISRDELENWVANAVKLGAAIAETQYSDMWKVMIDPEGHPFCLDTVII